MFMYTGYWYYRVKKLPATQSASIMQTNVNALGALNRNLSGDFLEQNGLLGAITRRAPIIK